MSEGKSANAYRTISEVAESLGVPQHVLRFWETKFPAVKPLKRGGNRRYYRPEDVEVLQVINHLLYVDGFTIKGVQKLLKERGARALVDEYLAAQAAGVTIAEFRFAGANGSGKSTAMAEMDAGEPDPDVPGDEDEADATPLARSEPGSPEFSGGGVAAAERDEPMAAPVQPKPAEPPFQLQAAAASPATGSQPRQRTAWPQARAVAAELKAIRAQLLHALAVQS